MGVRPLAAEVPLLDELLGVVPRPARVRHGEGEEHAAEEGAGEDPAQGFRTDPEADHPGHRHRDDPGRDHPPDRGGGRDVDATLRVRLGVPLQEARDLPELAPDLVDHVEGGVAHRGHRERGDEERKDPADEEPDQHLRLADRKGEARYRSRDGLHVGGDDREGGEGRRPDREPLADGRGGVADLVEGIGDRAGLLPEPAHLRDPARVVGNRAVGVDGHGHADRRKHPDRGESHSVEPREQARDGDDDAEGEHRDGHRLHALGEAGDDHGGGAGLAGPGDPLHRAARGVVLGDEADHDPADGPGEHREPDHEADVHPLDHDQGEGDEDHGGTDGPDAKRLPRIARREGADEGDPDERADEPGGGEGEGQEHEGRPFAEGVHRVDDHGGGDRDGGDHRAAVGLEDVRAHARHVAHIVAHVVGDDSGVAGIVLGDAGFDLADEVRPDVGALGEDAAPDAREEGHARRAHPEPVDRVRGLGVAAEEEVEGAEPEQPERGDGEAHDGAAEERDREGFVAAPGMGGHGGADVRPGGGPHADEARGGRCHRPRDEGQRRLVAEEEPQHHDEHETEPGQHRVLAAHEDHRPEVDLIADLRHLRVAGRVPADPLVDDGGGDEADDPEQGRNQSVHAHTGISELADRGSRHAVAGRGESSAAAPQAGCVSGLPARARPRAVARRRERLPPPRWPTSASSSGVARTAV